MDKIELCRVDACTQCNACQAICPKKCIVMRDAGEGFAIPDIDHEQCVKCGACVKACHRLSPHITYQRPLKNYACWTKKAEDREHSSSGGAFSVLAQKILGSGGVVYGAHMDEQLQVCHVGVETSEGIKMLQGSKYVQSNLEGIFIQVKAILNVGRNVLFTGTPCQIAGLLSYLHKKYENLYTCDVVCHGVPSQKAFDIYLEKIGLKGKCQNFSFRFTKGWGYRLSTDQGIVSPRKAYYIKAFTKGLMFNEPCYSCPYARPERISDFTLADYWGLGKKLPFHHSTRKGVSCLLVNNQRALNFLNDCFDLEREERPLDEAIEGNYNLSHASSRPIGRDAFFADSQTMSIRELCEKYDISCGVRDYLRLLKQSLMSLV